MNLTPVDSFKEIVIESCMSLIMDIHVHVSFLGPASVALSPGHFHFLMLKMGEPGMQCNTYSNVKGRSNRFQGG